VDGLRRLLGCSGNVWPVSTERATLCAAYRDGTSARGEPEVDVGLRDGKVIERVWLEPNAPIHPAAAEAIAKLDAMATGAQLISRQIGRPVDVIVVNQGLPDTEILARYAAEDKHPMPIGEIVGCSDIVTAPFWTGVYARHHRRRLAYALWGILARRLLG
jgi:hypothetical protein